MCWPGTVTSTSSALRLVEAEGVVVAGQRAFMSWEESHREEGQLVTNLALDNSSEGVEIRNDFRRLAPGSVTTSESRKLSKGIVAGVSASLIVTKGISRIFVSS
jgi:hypothetical protein